MASAVTLNKDFIDAYGKYIVVGVACLLALIRCCSSTEANQQENKISPPQVRKWNTQHNTITQQVLKTRLDIIKQ